MAAARCNITLALPFLSLGFVFFIFFPLYLSCYTVVNCLSLSLSLCLCFFPLSPFFPILLLCVRWQEEIKPQTCPDQTRPNLN